MRYLVFGSEENYPNGGAHDLLFKSNDKDEAIGAAKSFIDKNAVYEESDDVEKKGGIANSINWSHVLDLDKHQVIAEFGDKSYGIKSMCIKVKAKS